MFTLEQLHCKLRIASFPGSPGNEAILRIDTETLALFPACSMEMWEWIWWYLGIFPSCESHQDRKDGRKCFNCVSQKSTESKGTFELGTLPHIASY